MGRSVVARSDVRSYEKVVRDLDTEGIVKLYCDIATVSGPVR
jgi:hypothetical protein